MWGQLSQSSGALACLGEEIVDELAVARGEGERRELGERGPAELRVFEAGWFAVDYGGDELDQERGAGVGDGEERFTDSECGDAEFLGELAVGGGKKSFVGFELAAGKFPKTAVALMGGAEADEVAAVALNNRSDNWRRMHRDTGGSLQ